MDERDEIRKVITTVSKVLEAGKKTKEELEKEREEKR